MSPTYRFMFPGEKARGTDGTARASARRGRGQDAKVCAQPPHASEGGACRPEVEEAGAAAVQVQGVVTGTLASVIAGFPHDVSFQPEDETQGVPLNMLPDEILVHILLMVDVTTLERFATVSRKTRLLTLDSGIWRCVA